MERLDADLAACETLLEDSGAFLTGATPTQADCYLYGLVDHVRYRHPPALLLPLQRYVPLAVAVVCQQLCVNSCVFSKRACAHKPPPSFQVRIVKSVFRGTQGSGVSDTSDFCMGPPHHLLDNVP